MKRTRKRGAMVTPIKGAEGNVYYTFLLDNKVHIFGTEGVQVVLAPGGLYRGQWFGEQTEIDERDCRIAIDQVEKIDAADVIKVFGDRLEANFGLIYWKVTGEERAHDYDA